MANRNIILFPNPKINLGLLIKGKRSDGYHLLETLLYPVDNFCDELEIVEIAGNQPILEIEGLEVAGNIAENLCLRAYYALKEEFPDLPTVKIRLLKRIPPGSGLGGGSSDAAHMLSGLNDLFELGITNEELAQIGAKLGADVPFFLYNKPLLAKGIGTEFEELILDIPYNVKLITPDIHSSTVATYKALDAKSFDWNRSLRDILALPVSSWRDQLVNDLEVPVFQLYPSLNQIKEQLYEEGAVYAAMSGSGSAVFGLFPS